MIWQIWKFNNLGSNLAFLFTYSSKFGAVTESPTLFANIHFRHKYCNSLIDALAYSVYCWRDEFA